MTNYKFYNASKADFYPIDEKFKNCGNLRDFYDILCKCWSIETAAPGCREKFLNFHITSGQCSITSFLIQDIYGGEVYGTVNGGGFHSFNVINGVMIDLTSEQFANSQEYTLNYPQSRAKHFLDEDKEARYKLLKEKVYKEIFK